MRIKKSHRGEGVGLKDKINVTGMARRRGVKVNSWGRDVDLHQYAAVTPVK